MHRAIQAIVEPFGTFGHLRPEPALWNPGNAQDRPSRGGKVGGELCVIPEFRHLLVEDP